MFQEFMEWFKRFVMAHEQMAEAQTLTAQMLASEQINKATFGSQEEAGVPDGTECTATHSCMLPVKDQALCCDCFKEEV